MKSITAAAATALLIACNAGAQSDSLTCGSASRAALQILGSGGPMHGEGRGSAAYLIWYAGRPSIVVDMGGGAAAALARAGVSAAQIDALLISHLHPDHVSGLPDFLWGELVAERKHVLRLAGPSGGDGFPPVNTFLERQFGANGAFPYMQSLLTQAGFSLDVMTVSVEQARSVVVFERDGLRASAIAVPHGRAPALAYRIEGPDFSVVLGGDQTALDSGFSRFAKDAEVLVLHAMLTSEAAGHALARAVALPEDLGKRAAEANAKRVILSHLMSSTVAGRDARLWSLSAIEAVVRGVRTTYKGEVSVASDMQCFPL